MSGNVATAKTNHRKAAKSSSAVSLARAVVKANGEPQNVSKLIRLYYEEVPPSRANNMEGRVHYIYGHNAKVTSVGKKIIVKATGPNAFYYDVDSFYNEEEEYGGTTWTYNFSSKTDRDKFWNEFQGDGEPQKGYKNGWYWVSDFGD